VTDYLAPLPETRVAAWYRRLAQRIGREQIAGQEPLAAQFLRHWLDNRDSTSTLQFQPPRYLRTSSYVTTGLEYHRAVFLTERRARVAGGREIWAGVVPRIQGLSGFTRWDTSRPLDMHYESLVEVGSNPIDIARIQLRGTPEDRDLLAALRGFQLRSRVTVTAGQPARGRIMIQFSPWRAQVADRYDWDYTEHFTVPNPDYQSTRPDAIRPNDQTLTVYHRNAQRLERANLAAPYNITSNEWPISDPALIRPGEVDPLRRL
jgi:hypothetical protein